MRVVLDTNVLIAAFISHGFCSELLEYCGQQHRVVVSDFILAEFAERLVGKFKYSDQEAAAAADLITSVAETVIPASLGESVCRDPDDDAILATAVAGHVACIVTGDADLLVLREFRGIAILRPAEFAEFEAAEERKPHP
jgi:putative PIN family toxin of toxin-antitoxin system